MASWWSSMTTLQQWFAAVAIPATLILIIQTVLLLFGIDDGGDTDADFDADASFDHGGDGTDGLRLFTVRGIITFFTIGGWLGVVLLGAGLNSALSVILAITAGLIALVLTAVALKSITKLQEDGKVSIENAIGKTATVYIPIPKKGEGTGKVTVTVQERFLEFDAVTYGKEPLKTGDLVIVTEVIGESTLVVEKRK